MYPCIFICGDCGDHHTNLFSTHIKVNANANADADVNTNANANATTNANGCHSFEEPFKLVYRYLVIKKE